MELAAALAGRRSRAARQGADPRPGSENGNTAAASFDAVLNDVQGAAGNGTAAEPGAAKAVPAADDTAAELPQPDGATDPASLSGTAANTVTGADVASRERAGDRRCFVRNQQPRAGPIRPGPVRSGPVRHGRIPADRTARPNSPAQAQFVSYTQLGQAHGRLRCPDSRRRR